MASNARTGPRQLRRIVRTFFAYHKWMAALALTSGLTAWLVSYSQPTTFQGRMELACASDGAPTRVILPDVVRLRQLVLNPENLATLATNAGTSMNENERSTQLASIAKSVSLSPISSQTTGSSVWALGVEVPAVDLKDAENRIRRYADQIDLEFRERVRLARRAEKSSPAREPSNDRILPAAFQPPAPSAELPSEPSIPQPSAQDDPLAELANEFGVRVDQLPAIADSIRLEFGRRAKEIEAQDRRIDELIATVNRLESNDVPITFAAKIDEEQPTIGVLRQRRDELIEQRSKLASSLKPAHPDFQAVERMIQDVDRRLKSEQSKLAEAYRSQIAQLESSTKRMRNDLTGDQQRLAALEGMLASRSDIGTVVPVPSRQSTSTDSEPPGAMPALPGSALPGTSSAEIDRPIGRVVLPSPAVDPAPIRPKTSRNVVFAVLASLLAYMGFVVVRAGSDQRVHGVEDFEGIDADINVFGSIPDRRSGNLVRFTRA